jgi:hypothetical protein
MENIGLAPSWIAGFIVTGSFVWLALLALLGWWIHKTIFRYRENKRYEKRLAEQKIADAADDVRRAKDQYAYTRNYGHVYREKGNFVGWWVSAIVTGAIAVLIGVVQIIIAIPYDVKYMSWFTTSGVVERVDNRTLSADGSDITQNYVVTLEGNDLPFAMYDPRIVSLEGEYVTLLCGVSWNSYGNAADSWSCDIRSAPYTDN